MLREPNLTGGIGVRIAHNIHCTPTKDALVDRILTSVTSAKQKKTNKTAQLRELTVRSDFRFFLGIKINIKEKTYSQLLAA